MTKDTNKPIKVLEIEEHDDGSATIQVECDPETFAAIFEVGFVTLVKKGLGRVGEDSVKEKSQ